MKEKPEKPLNINISGQTCLIIRMLEVLGEINVVIHGSLADIE
jgi:hypothetical protein